MPKTELEARGKLENHNLCRGKLTQTGINDRHQYRNQRDLLAAHFIAFSSRGQATGNSHPMISSLTEGLVEFYQFSKSFTQIHEPPCWHCLSNIMPLVGYGTATARGKLWALTADVLYGSAFDSQLQKPFQHTAVPLHEKIKSSC